MLTFNLDGDVLEVREDMFGPRDTMTRYWYYNLRTRMGSRHGKRGDIPDYPLDRAAQAWIKTHYLPKIGLKDFP